jgi:hypothetical protein
MLNTCGHVLGELIVAGRQVGGREIMSATVKQKNQIWGMLPGVRPEKGHLAPEVKVASEIACDHVWDKLCPSPLPHTISVICSKLYIRKAPFVLGAQTLD